MSLVSPFSGDVKPAPNGKENANSLSVGSLNGSPATLSGPFSGDAGDVAKFHKAGPESVGISMMATVKGSPATTETPFETDMRPGVSAGGNK
jgi:hypothetical protein